jgi:multiple sugar transport system permease protein
MHIFRKGYWTLPRQEAVWAYIFIFPWIIGFIGLTVGPMIASLYFSLTRYDILNPPVWAGFENYRRLFSDPLFWKSMEVTLKFAVLALPLGLILGLFIAVLLNQEIIGLNLWRTMYYLPSVISGVAVAVLWVRIFNPKIGLLNPILESIGIRGPGWLQDPDWAVPALVIMSLWSIGGTMIIYLSGLQGVPTTLYEAAKVDGANLLQSFTHITLPMISPVIFYNLVIGLIGTFQYFTVAYTASGGSGGPARATLFYNLYLYQNAFLYSEMGYASAMAWVLFIIILLLTLLVFRSSGAWVYYEGQLRGRG